MGDLSLDISLLQESLEAEFCPPLDTTIVALLLSDHIPGGKPDGQILKTLRDQLSLLAASATVDQDDLGKHSHDLQVSAPSVTTDDSASRDADSIFSQTGLEVDSTSASSSSSTRDVIDPALAFLQASFPHTPLDRLKARLVASEVDMERIMEDLLSQEYLRELEERGLEPESFDGKQEHWAVVSRKPKPPTPGKKRKQKGKTITLNDIRQRHHTRPELPIRSSGVLWSQVASISSYLETMLDRPSSFFLSYFHNPQYPAPSAAVRAALATLEEQRQEGYASGRGDVAAALPPLMEVIRVAPEFHFNSLDLEAQRQLCTDAELSLAAVPGSPDKALDLVNLLYDLEMDRESMREMGVYHSPVSPLLMSPTTSQSPFSVRASTSTGSTPVSPVSPTSRTSIHLTPPSATQKKRPPPAPSQNPWQTVTPSRRKPPDVHPLAAHIPAYDPNNVPRRRARFALTSSKSRLHINAGGSSARGKVIPGDYKARIASCHARRDEALRTASRHWSNGGVRNHGGEVALYYAQEAQSLRAEAQGLQLDAMRGLVDRKRHAGIDKDTIDVHYCTTSEALTIVREVLDEGWVSSARHLRVITGRGTHSTGGVAVLGPAVKKALESDGWSVGKWDGGINIRGRV